MLGAGHLVPYLAAAHADIRPITHIEVWARNRESAFRAVSLIRKLRPGVHVAVATNIEAAVRSADIVSAATRATAPIIHGRWLRPGTHLDLVGGYRPDMRELDDEGIGKCRIFVDVLEAVLEEAGDLIDPIARGIICRSSILGELADLAAGSSVRTSRDEITLFKSVGTAIADLATAVSAWKEEGRVNRAAGE